jgi:predicted anti-sigma-YlaC factor YlaD
MNHYCKEASHLVSDSFERELKFTERLRLKLHLMICGMCRNHASSVAFMERLFEGLRTQVDEKGACLPEKARQRIQENLNQAMHSDH